MGGELLHLWRVSVRIHDNPIVDMDMFYASKDRLGIPAVYEIAKTYVDREYNDDDPYYANVQGVCALGSVEVLGGDCG